MINYINQCIQQLQTELDALTKKRSGLRDDSIRQSFVDLEISYNLDMQNKLEEIRKRYNKEFNTVKSRTSS